MFKKFFRIYSEISAFPKMNYSTNFQQLALNIQAIILVMSKFCNLWSFFSLGVGGFVQYHANEAIGIRQYIVVFINIHFTVSVILLSVNINNRT